MRNQTIIQSLIKEMLNELDRYEKETGKKWDASEELVDLEKMSTEEIAPGVPRYYFNMSSDVYTPGSSFTPMATPSPRARYKTTPYGYYTYPLDAAYLRKLKNRSLPYLDDSKWVTVIEATDAAGLMFTKNKMGTYRQARRDAFKKHGLTYGGSDDSGAIPRDVIATFTKLLIGKGFTWVYDPGDGIIHEAEPAQAVFLKTSAFRVVDRFQKKDIVADAVSSEDDWIYLDVLDGTDEPYDSVGRLVKSIPAITDVQRLKQLSKHTNITVKYAVATNPHTPVELFEEICTKFESIRYQLSTEFSIHSAHPRMPKLGNAKIKVLLRYRESAMIILRNTNDPELLTIIAKEFGNTNVAILFELARNPSTPEDVWMIMAKSPVVDTGLAVNHFFSKTEKVKCALLKNPVVKEDKEGHFMYAKEIYARIAVEHNQNNVLDALLSDPNPKVVEQTQAIIEKLKKRVAN